MSRRFDLNIEKILDNWEVYHAIREIIANALDEQILTKTSEVQISKDGSSKWHIRDYGRGLNYSHLTQNENDEKKRSKDVIGKFGVGLKDALAVLYKNRCSVLILSRFGDITLGMYPKEGFGDTKTLHAVIDEPSDPRRVGTEFILGVSDKDMEEAKSLFLRFSNKTPLDRVSHGEIYQRSSDQCAYVYVHGVKVAEEPMYLFDYNITRTNTALEKSLNRERSAVGRTAYSDIVMKMLLDAKSNAVAGMLMNDLKLISYGTNHDEISRVNVQAHAMRIYNEHNNVVFIPSSKSYQMSNNDKEKIRESGREVIVVPDTAFEKVEGTKDYTGKEIGTFQTVLREYSENFKYRFVEERNLTEYERNMLSMKSFVFLHYGNKKYLNKIRISENINEMISGDTLGVYDGSLDMIVLKRNVLSSPELFFEVLFHELAHATSKYQDNTRDFENELGKIIGTLSCDLIKSRNTTNQGHEADSDSANHRSKDSILNLVENNRNAGAVGSDEKKGDSQKSKTVHRIFGKILR